MQKVNHTVISSTFELNEPPTKTKQTNLNMLFNSADKLYCGTHLAKATAVTVPACVVNLLLSSVLLSYPVLLYTNIWMSSLEVKSAICCTWNSLCTVQHITVVSMLAFSQNWLDYWLSITHQRRRPGESTVSYFNLFHNNNYPAGLKPQHLNQI